MGDPLEPPLGPFNGDSSDPPPEVAGIEPSKPVRWTGDDQDYWLDLFQGFCETLLGIQPLEEDQTPTVGSGVGGAVRALTRSVLESEAHIHGLVKMAARLADTALLEMQARFWIHEEEKRKVPAPRRKLKGGYQPKTRQGRKNR